MPKNNQKGVLMQGIKAVFIDIDNTLLDFNKYVENVMKDGFERFNIGKFEPSMYDVFENVNNELWDKIERGEIDFITLRKIRWNLVFERIGYTYDGIAFENYFRDCLFNSAIPISGAYELLDYLKGKYVICIASNGPHLQQKHRIELAEMDKYIDYYFTSERMGVSKPNEEYYIKCLNELNVNRDEKIKKDEILVIGDSLSSDIYGSKKFGLKTCLYERKTVLNKKLENIADYTVEDLRDIIKILKD